MTSQIGNWNLTIFNNEQLHHRQANVALNLTKPSETKHEEERDENRENKIRRTDDATKSTPSTSQSFINVLKEEKKKQVTSIHDSTEQPKQQVEGSDSGAVDLSQSGSSWSQKPVQEDEKMVVSSPEPPVAEDDGFKKMI